MVTRDGTTGPGAERHPPANLELYLAVVGLLVVCAFTALRPPGRGTTFAWLLGVAGVMAGLYAVSVWATRRRQHLARQALVADMRAMLMDRVNNNLQVVHVALGELAEERGSCEHVATALAASRAVARTLDELSLEGLTRWRGTYQRSTYQRVDATPAPLPAPGGSR